MNMVSTVPACLDALVAAGKRALPDVQVVDGQPVEDIAGDLVCIGYAGDAEESVVESTRTREQVSIDPDKEEYEVTCAAWSWKGQESDPKAVRDGVYALVNALAADLAEDPTLGGVVARARLATESFAQGQTDRGAVAGVRFVIAVDAWTG